MEEGSVGAGVGTVAFGWKAASALVGQAAGEAGRVVIATDAPLDARNLRRMASRAMWGLARTGAAGTNGSGDYAIAFSTSREGSVKNDDTSPLFLATIEATEEAIYNSLFRATRVGEVEALPLDRVLPMLR